MKLGYVLLYVEDVAATMEFYRTAFGLETGFLHESKQYGEMGTGETKLGFVQHSTASGNGFAYEEMTLQQKPAACEIALVTDNVHTAFTQAIQAGAIALSDPKEKPWGQVVAYVRDCNGFTVELCSAMD